MAKATKLASKKSPKAPKTPQKAKTPQIASQTPQKGAERLGTVYRSATAHAIEPSSSHYRSSAQGDFAFKIVPAVVGELSDARAFRSRKPRNDNGKSWKDRVIQNVRTVSRDDYGKPIREILKMEVRTQKGEAGLFKMPK